VRHHEVFHAAIAPPLQVALLAAPLTSSAGQLASDELKGWPKNIPIYAKSPGLRDEAMSI
jgi:hypothetical protein